MARFPSNSIVLRERKKLNSLLIFFGCFELGLNCFIIPIIVHNNNDSDDNCSDTTEIL